MVGERIGRDLFQAYPPRPAGTAMALRRNGDAVAPERGCRCAGTAAGAKTARNGLKPTNCAGWEEWLSSESHFWGDTGMLFVAGKMQAQRDALSKIVRVLWVEIRTFL